MGCKYTVDRIEGEYAVCEGEDGQMMDIPLSSIEGDVKESVTLTETDGKYKVAEGKQDSNRALFDKLFKKGR